MVPPISLNTYSSFSLRALSSLVLGPIVLAAVWFGGNFFIGLLFLIALIVGWEWGHLVTHKSMKLIAVISASMSWLGILLMAWKGDSSSIVVYALALLTVSLSLGVYLRFSTQESWRTCLWATAGMAYLSFCTSAMSWLRLSPGYDGTWLCLWLLAVVWATDIAAYLCGRIIGGPKLAPRISPQKTWSGFIGGTLFGVIVSVAITFTHLQSIWLFLLLGGVIAIAAHLGDLLESTAKRYFGVKDTGRLIPGHGGLLDRIDGLVMAAVVFAALIWLEREGIWSWV
ncbi:MAG: phosphatidate cytidylyltransferase [Alphaproteobacteria bacterium]